MSGYSRYDTLNNQVDTAAPLWERSFMCRIPQLQSTSLLYLQRVGTFTSGDKNVDRELADQLLTTFKPVHEMAELHRDGVPVYVCKRDDIKTIYDLVDTHLQAWKTAMGTGLNKRNAPLDDLIALDAFAHSIFGHAKFDMAQAETGSPFMRYLAGLEQSVSMRPIDVVLEPLHTDEDPEEITRESFVDVFKKSMDPKSMRRWDNNS